MRPLIPTLVEDAMTLSKVMGQCLQHLAAIKDASPGTIDQYDRHYRQFLAYLSSQGLQDSPRSFTEQTVLGWTMHLGTLGIKSNTILSKLGALSTLAQFAMHLRDPRGRPILTENPTKAVEWPEKVQTETAFLYPDELRRFLEVERPMRESIARDLFIDTALRVSELCEANCGDLKEVDGRTYLLLRVKGRRKRNQERKRIPISGTVAESLKDYLLARGMPGDAEPLLVSSEGHRWSRSGLTQVMTRIGRRAGIERFSVSAHKLRHTSNVIARHAGIDMYTRSRLLNHGNTQTTERYEHLIPDELHEVREQHHQGLQKYLGRAQQPESRA